MAGALGVLNVSRRHFSRNIVSSFLGSHCSIINRRDHGASLIQSPR